MEMALGGLRGSSEELAKESVALGAPHLVMPVFRGDIWWEQSLGSVSNSRDLFDLFIVSFDGIARREQAACFSSEYGKALEATVLVTPEDMTSVEHFRWIFRDSLCAQWEPEQLVMILAEDDLLIRDSTAAALKALGENEGAALFGDWSTRDDWQVEFPAPSSKAKQVGDGLYLYSASIKQTLLDEIENSRAVTSISGITLPSGALVDYVDTLFPKPGLVLSSGVRAEYLLVNQPPVKSLIRSLRPMVHVTLHMDRESVITKNDQWKRDDAFFNVWKLLRVRPTSRSTKLRLASRILMNIVRHPDLIPTYARSWRALRMGTNDD